MWNHYIFCDSNSLLRDYFIKMSAHIYKPLRNWMRMWNHYIFCDSNSLLRDYFNTFFAQVKC